jgi:hypothetical protein
MNWTTLLDSFRDLGILGILLVIIILSFIGYCIELLKRRVIMSGSTIVPVSQPSETIIESSEEPVFRTLRITTTKIDNHHWRFQIKFLFLNTLKEQIVFDDVHVKLYRRYVVTSPVLSIGHRGEMELLQDNSLQKKQEVYSLEAGDGFEIVLNLGISSNESGVLAVFGLFIDYYTIPNINRSSIPSDCVYLFFNSSQRLPNAGELKIISNELINELKSIKFSHAEPNEIMSSLDKIVIQHSSSRPIPKV